MPGRKKAAKLLENIKLNFPIRFNNKINYNRPYNKCKNITLDGNLSDWTVNNRLDFLTGTGQPGYEIYGQLVGDNYVFAIKSDSTAIASGTTVWLNTDRDTDTGYQVFGSTVGAEYNVNFFTDNAPYLYTGAAGQNFISSLNYAYNSDRTVEFAVPASQVGNLTSSN